ncbi:hypothetical protein [Cellulomonas wangsupingiae]|uniref:2TM domain-containing protein n=1 Tax=Cellulomonas wangsupingiae TaxID=2968085 RepID=A0ABY5K6E8_9CELL|nr:hypothetical protein [Cellulomonas wangsupingiae]MCC2335051.1 hypothetical protein [Cellulomonas wangsupingiae]MCM0638921.1 hypothetical protein [Cellulomonas wangsupingiae]UUI65550.1 hypothetical protein NP075_02060 [Cellulomonas wangsupingiae]
MPVDRDVPPDRHQRWLVRHTVAYRAVVTAVAVAGVVAAIWMTTGDGFGYWWLITLGLVLNAWVGWRSTNELGRFIAEYDRTHPPVAGDAVPRQD